MRLRVYGLGFRAKGVAFRVENLWFSVYGLGQRV